MDTSEIFQLVIIFILLFLSAFFSSAETAFSTVNKIRLQTMADAGDKRAALACKILSNYGKMLSTVLIGNNIVNISTSAITTVFATNLFGSWAVGIATGVLTVLVLLFGEIIPKTWAMLNNDKLSIAYAPFINFLCIIFTPLVFPRRSKTLSY